MKKGLIFAALALVIMMFSSCQPATKATVNVTVTKAGEPQAGVVVYMFNEDYWEEALTDPFDATKKVVTEEDGVAVFNLNVLELEIIDSQTTLYFAVFDEYEEIRGYTAVTVKKGDNKRIELKLNR